jgi:hypothetical protein
VKLPKLLRGVPAAHEGGSAEQPRRRRRAVRPDAPRTIIPVDGDDARTTARPDADTPSWLHARPSTPMSLDLDAARARLRRDIPPVSDDE